MQDDIHKPAVIAAVVILLVVAVLVRARAFVTLGSSRGDAPRNGRRLNTTVDFVPLSGVQVQRANHGGEVTDGQGHLPHHLRPVNSVTSLRYPPPAYPAHHLDPRYGGVAYGYGNIGRPIGSTVDAVPLPPSYTTSHSGGDHLHL